MKTLLVTLNYNTPLLIRNLSNSLIKALPKQGWDWFIRDNSSNQESLSVIDSIKDPRIKIKSYNNEGNYSSMHNDLSKEGIFDSYDNIVLLNSDTIALNDFITPMLSIMRNPLAGCVGARLWFPNRELQHCGIVLADSPRGMPVNVSKTVIEKLRLYPQLAQSNRIYQAVTGACLMLRRADYEKLNGLDEKFEWCFDDVDLCFRMYKELGKYSITSANSDLIHVENHTISHVENANKPKFHEAYQRIRGLHHDIMIPDTSLYRMEYNLYA